MDCGNTVKTINSPSLKRKAWFQEGLKSAVLFPRNKVGTAAVEFAILAPVFLLLLMGVIAFGIYLGAANAELNVLSIVQPLHHQVRYIPCTGFYVLAGMKEFSVSFNYNGEDFGF